MCWLLMASLLRGQDTTLQHSQLPATSATEVGLRATRLLDCEGARLMCNLVCCLVHLNATLLVVEAQVSSLQIPLSAWMSHSC